MGGCRRHRRQAMTTRQLSEDVVVTGIGGSAMIGQLDHDIVDTEEINQVMASVRAPAKRR